jgi:hypothetical protein
MPRRRRERKRFVQDDFATLWRCALTAEYENASTGVNLGNTSHMPACRMLLEEGDMCCYLLATSRSWTERGADLRLYQMYTNVYRINP